METAKTGNHRIVDGYLMRWDSRSGEWVRWMPVAEWNAREAAVDQVSALMDSGDTEAAQKLLAQKQAEIRKMRKNR
jgi:hypothetical protein